MKIYGLLGKNISYSFSGKYFNTKFNRENIPAEYQNFDLEKIGDFKDVVVQNPTLSGLNVTIPYKEEVIPFLDALDPVAKEIGAVNTIKIEKDNRLTGYNTDFLGFRESLKPHLKSFHTHALILGTGGASKAVAYALKELEIKYKFVSRTPKAGNISYDEMTGQHLQENLIIINCTPLGTFPNSTSFPPIPIKHFTSRHLVYDLIYNPEVTQLMNYALEQNATVINGEQMLILQAEEAWKIWNQV